MGLEMVFVVKYFFVIMFCDTFSQIIRSKCIYVVHQSGKIVQHCLYVSIICYWNYREEG